MWASYRIGRIVETRTRGCQNYSLPDTHDILNFLTGNLHDNERDGEPALFRDEQ